MAIDYNKLESDICSILCPVTVGENNVSVQQNTIYEAKPLPNNEAEYTRAFTKPIAFVACVGGDFSEPQNTDIMVQDETLTIELILRAKSRTGTDGIFAIISDIKTKLLGYKLFGFTKFRFIRHGYIDGQRTNNDWNYMVSFSTIGRAIENLPEPITVPISQITTNSD